MSMENRIENDFFSITKKYLEQNLTLREFLELDTRPSQIQPVLIDIVEKLSKRKSCTDLVKNYELDRFSEPATLKQREIANLTSLMYKNVPDVYDDVELSPVAPLGTNSILTEVSQKAVISTVRNTEVLADPTTMLALESARRQRNLLKGSTSDNFDINLCTSVRCIRGQVFSKESGFIPHFQLFSMSSGGLSASELMAGKINEHLETYLDFLNSENSADFYSANSVKVAFSNINLTESLIKSKNIDRKELGRHSQDNTFDFFKSNKIDLPSSVSDINEIDLSKMDKHGLLKYYGPIQKIFLDIENLRKKYSSINFCFDLDRVAGIGYYDGSCFKLTASNNRSEEFPLADGGYSDWLAKLLSNKKISYFSSGFGLELFGSRFKK